MKTWTCKGCGSRRPRRSLAARWSGEWPTCKDEERCIMRGAARGRAGVRRLLGDYRLERRNMWRRILAEHKHTAEHGKPEWFGSKP